MSELEFYYHIRASLPPKPETPASLGAKFLQTLDALSRTIRQSSRIGR
jgi:hypothetical protein